jgi:hypothetical protein
MIVIVYLNHVLTNRARFYSTYLYGTKVAAKRHIALIIVKM